MLHVRPGLPERALRISDHDAGTDDHDHDAGTDDHDRAPLYPQRRHLHVGQPVLPNMLTPYRVWEREVLLRSRQQLHIGQPMLLRCMWCHRYVFVARVAGRER
jgi:hypothetical protein